MLIYINIKVKKYGAVPNNINSINNININRNNSIVNTINNNNYKININNNNTINNKKKKKNINILEMDENYIHITMI